MIVNKYQVNMYGTIKTLAKLLLSVHTSRAAESRSLKEILLVFSSTACHSTVALLQTGTSILHRNFLSAHYLSILSFSMSGKCAECTMIARNIEWSVTRRSNDGWRRVKPEHCWSVLRGIYFQWPKIQCIPSKWTKRFFEVHNLPQWIFVLELLEESFQP